MLSRFQLNKLLWTLCVLFITGGLTAGNRQTKNLKTLSRSTGLETARSDRTFNKFRKQPVGTSVTASSQEQLSQALENMRTRIPLSSSKREAKGNPSGTKPFDRIFSGKQNTSARPFLSRLETSDKAAIHGIDRVWWDEKCENPIFVKCVTDDHLKKSSPMTVSEMNETALSVIESYSDLFRLDSPREELRLAGHEQDPLGFVHMRYQQFYQAMKIRGSELVVHLSHSGQVSTINGRFRSTPVHLSDRTFTLSKNDAIGQAYQSAGITEDRADEITAEKMIYQDQVIEPCLAWHIEIFVKPFLVYTVYIHGENGTVLSMADNIRNDGAVTGSGKDLMGTTRSLHLYKDGNQYYMIDTTKDMYSGWDDPDNLPDGALVTWNCKGAPFEDEATGDVSASFNPSVSVSSQTNQWRQDEVSAAYSISMCYDYYKTTHGRKGMDDKNMSPWVHVNTDYENACNLSGTQYFIFGNGDDICLPYIRDIDVLAHEYGHGITSFSSRLEYEYQSGALNEAFSDYSGVMVEHYAGSGNWQMGEDIMRPASGYTCLRDLANPHNPNAASQHPANMSEYENLSKNEDNGGVHVNCTIPGHAIYLISQKIGFDNMESLIYRTFTQYLVPLAQFVDFRLGALQAAEDLGFTETQKTRIGEAFDEVEIHDGGGTSSPDPYTPVSGDDYVLGVDPGDGQMLRLDSTLPYSEDKLAWFNAYTYNKPSITEDGSAIVYIDLDGQLCLYDTEANENNVINSDIPWHNAAISPKGDYLALIPDPEEYPSTLIILDLENDQQSVRTLYVPSQTEGTQVKADYADILDWTNDGGYLVYDCCLTLDSGSNSDWSNWSICITSAEDENYGVVLAAGNDLIYGNPSISSTRDYVIAFDAMDFSSGSDIPDYYIATYDMSSGVFGNIIQNDYTYGHPGFSPDDSKIVFQDKNSSDEYYLTQMDLQADKLNGNTSTLQGWIKPVQYPVWYATGTRSGGGGGGSGSVIFSENFDDWDPYGTFPPANSGWSLSSSGSNYTWMLWNPDPGFGTIDPGNTNSAYIFFDASENQLETLTSPDISLQGSSVLEFWVYYSSAWLSNYDLKLYVQVGNNSDLLWELENDGTNYEWKQFSVELPSEYANRKIKLKWVYSGLDGFSVALDGIRLTTLTSAVDGEASLPESFSLSNTPNPFNPSTTIRFSVPERQKVRISMYNTSGQKITELLNETVDAGMNQVVWDASGYPTGLYFIRMNNENQTLTRKCMLVK